MPFVEKEVLGPIFVTDEQKHLKLFAICHLAFTSLSKKELRELFISGSVLVNGVPLLSAQHQIEAHEVECKRVQVGDKVEILIDRRVKFENLAKSFGLNVLHCDENIGACKKKKI
jgi:hypothetical protein